jgi:hypothetical protein
MVKVPKKPLSITCGRKEKDQTLAKNRPTIRKRGGLQDQKELVDKP